MQRAFHDHGLFGRAWRLHPPSASSGLAAATARLRPRPPGSAHPGHVMLKALAAQDAGAGSRLKGRASVALNRAVALPGSIGEAGCSCGGFSGSQAHRRRGGAQKAPIAAGAGKHRDRPAAGRWALCRAAGCGAGGPRGTKRLRCRRLLPFFVDVVCVSCSACFFVVVLCGIFARAGLAVPGRQPGRPRLGPAQLRRGARGLSPVGDLDPRAKASRCSACADSAARRGAGGRWPTSRPRCARPWC
jgi:hypothetical protein